MKRKRLLLAILTGALALCAFIGIVASCVIFSPLNTSEELYGATVSRDHNGMLLWLRRGGDPNARFDGTTPPLEPAIEQRDYEAVAILLTHGAHPIEISVHHQHLLEAPDFQHRLAAFLPRTH